MSHVDSMGSVLLVQPSTERSIDDLSDEEVKRHFMSAGALLFRGFEVNARSMKGFADRFSCRFNRDRLRPTVNGSDGLIQRVNEGMGYAQPHAEQANSPFRPDAIWFCCEQPAATGGETLLWDGVRLWQQLSEEMKDLFRSKKIRFFQRYGPERWRLFLGPKSSLTSVEQTLSGIENLSYFIADDDSVYLEYLCSAVVRTRYGDQEAFTNSLLSEQENTLEDLMAFDDGTPVSEELLEELRAALAPLTEPIHWSPGDLVMLDNSRFLHGRNAFTDVRRTLYSCMSFLSF